MKTKATAIFSICVVAMAHAFPVHKYQGLAKIIDKASDIAAIRIDECISGNGLTYDTYSVTILDVIKGQLQENEAESMALAHLPIMGSYDSTEGRFQLMAKYLVFLVPNAYTNFSGTYMNMQMIGSCWKLPSDMKWQIDTNQNIQHQLKACFDSQGWETESTEQGDGD